MPDRRMISQQILILTGPVTASAAEVLARALKFHDMAFVVGGETFGKCLSQKIFKLPDGSQLSLSNRRILDPDGNYCHGKGLIPDVPVSDNELGNTQLLIRKGLFYIKKEKSADLPTSYNSEPEKPDTKATKF